MQTNEIKISVMIPVYNTSQYLRKCLDSIINQSLKEIEIICVNDGSTDNSLDILKEYEKKDNRIIVVSKENGGLTSARNKALELAKGEYSLNIDSDDWIKEGYLEKIYLKAKKDNLDMLITDIIYSEKMGGAYKTNIIKDLNLLDSRNISGQEYIQNFFENNFLGYTWNKLIKTELYKKYDLRYNEKIFLFEDIEMILRISYFCRKIGKLNEAFYYYRQGENNGVRKIKLKNLTDMELCFDSLIRFYKDKKEDWILRELIQTKKLFYTSEILSNKYDNLEKYSEILKEYFEYIKKEQFITDKFTCDNKRIFGKNERLFLCFGYNLVKILPLKMIVEFLKRIRNALS